MINEPLTFSKDDSARNHLGKKKMINKSKLALLALIGFAFAPSINSQAADFQVAQFINERVDESVNPLKRFKEKVKNVKSKISAKKKSFTQEEIIVSSPQNFNDNQIEPEISPVQIPKQYEEDAIALWKRPNYVAQEDWLQIIESVKAVGKKTGIPEQLILSLINKESGFNPKAVSRSGAIGLTQLMPNTAKYECGLSPNDLYDISVNINCGISYLDKQIKYFRKLDLAIAAYNAGPGAVRRAVEKAGTEDINAVTALLKPETKPYVSKILARINYGDDFI